MKCPSCETTLVMSERHGVEIDHCPQCRGVWLDRGELDKIIERAARFEDDDDDDRRRQPAPPPPPPYGAPPPPPPYGGDYRGDDYRGGYRGDDYRGGYRGDDRHKYYHKKKSFWSELFD